MTTALDTVIELTRRIYKDDPDIAVSHLAAEVCRAACGVGRYALRYPKPRGAEPPPAAPTGGKKGKQKKQAAQGRLF